MYWFGVNGTARIDGYRGGCWADYDPGGAAGADAAGSVAGAGAASGAGCGAAGCGAAGVGDDGDDFGSRLRIIFRLNGWVG